MKPTLPTKAALALAALLGLGAAGCGEEEAPPPPKPQKAAKDPAAAKPGAAGKKGGPALVGSKKKAKKPKKMALEVYPRIDDKYRRELKEADFLPDPSGEERRDPFQSFIVRQGADRRVAASAAPIQPTDICTAKNSRAPGYLLRDMRLIGIVLRGTNSSAQFRDKRGFGWIVKRGDCLGKEKAVVQSIGVGSVTLEVIPETPPNAPPPPPQRQDIALYPEDFDTGAALGEDAAALPEPPPSSPSTPSGAGSRSAPPTQ